MFMLIFIAVIMIQIFYKKRTLKKEKEEYEKSMGPLEKSLNGKGPKGQRLTEKQLKEIRDIDGMLQNMGNLSNFEDFK